MADRGALEQYSLKKVAIIDFDGHHGNGTENIFRHGNRVLLLSSFQQPFYPFSNVLKEFYICLLDLTVQGKSIDIMRSEWRL